MIVTSRVNSLETLHYDLRDAGTGSRRVRRSAGSASSPALANHTGSLDRKLRLAGDMALFLMAAPDSNSLCLRAHVATNPQFCFQMYTFDLAPSPSEGGMVVVIEAHDGRHVTQDSANPQSLILTAGEAPQQTHTTDSRFFHMYHAPGDRYFKLKHLHSGMFLSASSDAVSLLSVSGNSPDSILFTNIECTHT